MSILIKGIKVHRGECWNCPCLDGEYGECNVLEEKANYVDKKDCPLIELPDHGDLIDRDALSREMYHEAFETDSALQKWDSGCWIRYKMFEKHRDAAPVVIPAERREE